MEYVSSSTIDAPTTKVSREQSSALFNLADEVAALRGSSAWRKWGLSSRTLVRQPGLRLVLVALRAAQRIGRHRTDRTLSVQTLDGHLVVDLPDRAIELPAGRVLVLDEDIPHGLWARQDSTFLLSLARAPHEPRTSADPIDELLREHRDFSAFLHRLEDQLAEFHLGNRADFGLARDMAFQLARSPEQSHQSREEPLFVRIAERAPAAAVHVATQASQHRKLVELRSRFQDSLEDVLDGAVLTRQAVEGPALDYIALLRKQMRLEEQELFPLARAHLALEDWQQLGSGREPGELNRL